MRPLRLLLALAFALAVSSSPVADAAVLKPSAVVSNLASRVLAIFNNPKLSFADREKRMHALAVQDFDVPYSARFVLGSYWKAATEKERADFVPVYEDYIVHVYARQFDAYHDVAFKLLSERTETPTHTIVVTEISRRDGRPPIRVNWRVATNGDTHKITDVRVEGVSQLLSLREQFSELIQHDQGGVAMLTDRLREKTRA